MSAVVAIAGNTVRELVRGKLLYNLLLFAALFVAGSLLVAQLTIGNWVRIILDMALALEFLSKMRDSLKPEERIWILPLLERSNSMLHWTADEVRLILGDKK